jgi:hypothetical protein
MIRHLGISQDAVQDFELGKRALEVISEPRLLCEPPARDFSGERTISLSENADKVGPAPLDLLQTDRQNLAPMLLFLGYPPPQINLPPGDPAQLAKLPQLREDSLDQNFPLFEHIHERRGYEDTNDAWLELARH